MSFVNPWGLLSLLSVPALIALYILKQKHKEVRVPSLFLWQKTQSMMEASTPWQKLKKSLLFILQLLAVILICMAIARPTFSGTKLYDEITVIIDASASMQAEESGSTRFEKAIKQAENIVGSLTGGRTMNIIFATDTIVPAISHSGSQTELKKALKSCECGWSGADIENALILADSLETEGTKTLTMIITDCDISVDSSRSDVEYMNVAEGRKNAAVLSVSCGAGNNGFTVLSVVKSVNEATELNLELRCDGILTDAMKVSVEKNESKSVYWRNIDQKYSQATVVITNEDSLMSDNSLTVPLVKKEQKKVLLVSESGFFFEKIFAAIGGYDVYKIAHADYMSSSEEQYDLYIFDQYLPDKMPESGSVWVFSPQTGFMGLTVSGFVKGSSLSAAQSDAASTVCGYLNVPQIAVSGFYEIENTEKSWEEAVYCGLLPVILLKTTNEGQRYVCVAFDIHDSNLPLLKEFPILIQNLLNYTVPSMTDGSGVYTVGTIPEIHALAYSTQIEISNPAGEVERLAPPFPISEYKLMLPGIYTLTQTLSVKGTEEEKKVVGIISAGIPEEESEMSSVGFISGGNTSAKPVSFKGRTEIWPYLIIAVLILMSLEWWVYYREY